MQRRTLQHAIAFIVSLTMCVAFFVVLPVHAQNVGQLGLEQAQNNIGLGSGNLTLTVARILRGFFALLGILAVVFVVYGGVVWMTAGGSEEKVGTAKKIMLNGGIGLAIILSAFSIASFVISSIAGAVGIGAGDIGSAGTGGNGGGGGYGYADNMTVKMPGSTHAGFVSEFDLYFYKNFGNPAYPKLETVRVGDSLTITENGRPVDVDVIRDANMLVLRAKQTCPQNHGHKTNCFDNDGSFTITLAGGFSGITSDDDIPLDCSDANPCSATVTTGHLDDAAPPTGVVSSLQEIGGAGIQYFSGGGVPIDTSYSAQGNASDDVEVKYVKLSKDGVPYVAIEAPLQDGFYPSQVNFTQAFDTKNMTALSAHTIGVEVADTSGNVAHGTDFTYTAVGAMCGNGKQDSDETGIDCGGASCLACTGNACTSDSQCTSGACDLATKQCVQDPVIYAVTPNDGAPRNFVTITGKGFGTINPKSFVEFGEGGKTQKGILLICTSGVPWSDTQIVAQLPSGATSGAIKIQRADGKFDTTNAGPGPKLPDFTFNTTFRPGINCVTPDTGYFGTLLSIRGGGWGGVQSTSSSVSVGGIPVAPKSWQTQTISAPIPSITPGPQSVIVKVGGEQSNPFTITVKEVQQGEQPVITSVSPEKGGPGTVVTIQGSGFGDKKGSVFFGEKLGDMGFAAQCGNGQWTNNRILVKIPQDATQGSVQLTIERVEPTLKAKSVAFTVDQTPPGPSICNLEPDNGPVGTKVKITGEQFGQPGKVEFSGSKSTTQFTAWNQSLISDAVVPNDSASGDVQVVTAAAAGSNKFPFVVNNCVENGCSADKKCCTAGSEKGSCVAEGAVCAGDSTGLNSRYEWFFSTGKIPTTPALVYQCGTGIVPSPAPWNGRNAGSSVCVNAKVTGVFNVSVQSLHLGTDIVLEQCTGGDSNPCATTTKVDGKLYQQLEGGLGFEIVPSSPLAPDARYRVTLGTDIATLSSQGSGGHIPMNADPTCAKPDGLSGSPSACFSFTTQKSSEACKVKSVLVSPHQWISDTPVEQTILQKAPSTDALVFEANGQGDDQCVVLNTDSGPWSWSIKDDPNPYSVDFQTTAQENQIHLTGKKENTPGKFSKITADYTNGDTSKASGFGELNISLAKPEIVGYSPNCDKACLNGLLAIEFNTPMQFVSSYYVSVYQCADETCKSLLAPTEVKNASTGDMMHFKYTPTLTAHSWYRVIVKGGPYGVRSKSGATLSNTNYGTNFSWTFRTRDAEDLCVPASVTVEPIEATVKAVSQTVGYAATPRSSPDKCDPKGQFLSPWNYGWKWKSNDEKVATVGNGISVAKPAYCTPQCRFTGSEPLAAVCGDGVLNKKFEACEDGNTKDDDGCSSRCMLEGSQPVSKGGTCGNGTIDKGEACDDKNEVAGDGCSAVCLLEGSSAGGSVCGNGDKGPGEACDDGNTVSGDGCSAVCLLEGSPKFDVNCAEVTSNSSAALQDECKGVVKFAMCGNGNTEKGEECDDGNTNSGDGCSANCLREGTNNLGQGGLCGNKVIDKGEQCDDGNATDGDGCSSHCLYEASQTCGNEKVETGEDCDPSGDKNINVDPTQIATAVGKGTVDHEVQKTDIVAQVIRDPKGATIANGASGSGAFTLQCGYTSDSECQTVGGLDPQKYGRASNSCCDIRPTITTMYPAKGATNVCLNTAIWMDVDAPLDLNTLTGNIGLFVSAKNGTTNCPNGLPPVQLSSAPLHVGFWSRVATTISSWFGEVVLGHAAVAESFYCPASIEGTVTATISDNVTHVNFAENNLLESGQTYYMALQGGPQGAKSASGVGFETGWHSFNFRAGSSVCALDHVKLDQHEVLLTVPAEAHIIAATAYTKDGAQVTAIPKVYDWSWSWGKSVENPTGAVVYPHADGTLSDTPDATANALTIAAAQKQGEVTLTGIAKITTDGGMKTKDATFNDSAHVSVMVCENPWPRLSNNKGLFADTNSAAYSDDFGPGFSIGGGANPPKFTNFATRYCRDPDAKTDENHVLPALAPLVIGTPPNTDTTLKEFFFSPVDDSGVKIDNHGVGDVIGIRVEKNQDHLPLGQWYKARGFTGSPQTTSVDGFSALQDGRTLYISGLNAELAGTELSALRTNVYVLSYNQGAAPDTIAIFNKLVAHFKLMVNAVPSGLCYLESTQNASTGQKSGSEPIYTTADGKTISCSADRDCAAAGAQGFCDNAKAKAGRDLERISDFGTLKAALTNYYTAHNSYPVLASGTFLPGTSVSTWSSWQSELGNALGTSAPADPLNTLTKCVDPDADPATCWNAKAGTYACPLHSHLYEYDVLQGGQNYVLKSEFEMLATLWQNNMLGNPNWQTGGICQGTSVSASSKTVCGNNILEPNGGEECDPPNATIIENGTKYTCTKDCKKGSGTLIASVSCGNGSIDPGEKCDDGVKNGTYGFCKSNCSGYAQCGNGTIENAKSDPKGPEVCEITRCPLAPDIACSGPFIDCYPTQEIVNQKGYDVSKCTGPKPTGNDQSQWQYNCGVCGALPTGTVYAKNKENSCNWDCRSFGPFCGDGIVSNGEECDKGTGGNGGAGTDIKDCTIPGTTQPGQTTRKCGSDCKWAEPISDCKALDAKIGGGVPVVKEGCGDAVKDVSKGEECDLGSNNGVLCSAPYGSYCSYCTAPDPAKFVAGCTNAQRSGGFCGDGKTNGPEACDTNDFDASKTQSCAELGFDYGNPKCNNQCSGVTTDTCQKCGALAKTISAEGGAGLPAYSGVDITGSIVDPTIQLAKDAFLTSSVAKIFYKTTPHDQKNSSDGTFAFALDNDKNNGEYQCTDYHIAYSKDGYTPDTSEHFGASAVARFMRGYLFGKNLLQGNRMGLVVEWDTSVTDLDTELDVVDGSGETLTLNKNIGTDGGPGIVKFITGLFHAYLYRIDSVKQGYETMVLNLPTASYRLNQNGDTYYFLRVFDNKKTAFAHGTAHVNVKLFDSKGLKQLFSFPKDVIYSTEGNALLTLLSGGVINPDGNSFNLIFKASADGKTLEQVK